MRSSSLFKFSEGNVDSVSVHKRLLMFIQMVGLCQVVVVVKHERQQLSQHRPQVTIQYSTVQCSTVQYSTVQYSTGADLVRHGASILAVDGADEVPLPHLLRRPAAGVHSAHLHGGTVEETL